MASNILKRVKPVEKLDDKEWGESIQLLETTFGKDWLGNATSHNPLCLLWQKTDFFAQQELFTLSSAIKIMNNIDRVWVRNKIKEIKGKDINNCRGALFELIGASYFSKDDQQVIPAKNNNPGVDMQINFSNGNKINWSMKNYGISAHQRDFNANFLDCEDLLKAHLIHNKITSLQIVITFMKYPASADWKEIKKNIPQILQAYVMNKNLSVQNYRIPPLALFSLCPLSEYENLNFSMSSYIFIGWSPYHDNEHKNLLDKLDEACANLCKYAKSQDVKEVNGIYIHLHSSALINDCQKWIDDYFSNHPDSPISYILLHQPTLTRNLENNTSNITHCVKFISNTLSNDWLKELQHSIQLVVPFGIVSENLSNQTLVSGDIQIPISGFYIQQTGNIYTDCIIKSDGSTEGHISNIASGIKQHCFLKFPGQNQSVMISDKVFPKEDELTIL